jgi:hypothetical protein
MPKAAEVVVNTLIEAGIATFSACPVAQLSLCTTPSLPEAAFAAHLPVYRVADSC